MLEPGDKLARQDCPFASDAEKRLAHEMMRRWSDSHLAGSRGSRFLAVCKAACWVVQRSRDAHLEAALRPRRSRRFNDGGGVQEGRLPVLGRCEMTSFGRYLVILYTTHRYLKHSISCTYIQLTR